MGVDAGTEALGIKLSYLSRLRNAIFIICETLWIFFFFLKTMPWGFEMNGVHIN